VVTCALAAACSTSPSLAPIGAERAELAVERGTLEEHVMMSGVMSAADSDELSVPRTRTWQLSIRWLADDGARVSKGDRLMEFDNSALVQQLRELELAIVRADNELAAQEASDAVAIADKELEAERQRIETAKAELDAKIPRSLLSKSQFQEYQLKLEQARTAHKSAIDDLEAARKAAALEQQVKRLEYDKAVRTYERTTEQLDALVLRAPRDGVLVIADHPWFGRRLQVGDMVRPGFDAAEVSNLGKMEVTAQLSDVDDGQIAVGMPATCILDAYPDRPFAGTIESISEIAVEPHEKSTRRFFEVTVALDTTDTEVMRPGMSVRVDVLARTIDDALIAPRAGLRMHADGTARALLAGGDDRPVEVELCTDRACAIASGLDEGDRLRYPEVDR
jgi:multidrug efflux pump subunit AcrA (membrane-fusion protein)